MLECEGTKKTGPCPARLRTRHLLARHHDASTHLLITMQALTFQLTLALGGTLLAASVPPAPVPPVRQSAAAMRQSCDFGAARTDAQSPVEHTFRVTNSRPTVVVWERLVPTCHCTSAAALVGGVPSRLPVTLKPGQTLSVLVSLDTRGLAPGPTTRYVYLFERGQSVPVCTLEMTGIVRAAPASQDIGRGPGISKHFMRTSTP